MVLIVKGVVLVLDIYLSHAWSVQSKFTIEQTYVHGEKNDSIYLLNVSKILQTSQNLSWYVFDAGIIAIQIYVFIFVKCLPLTKLPR